MPRLERAGYVGTVRSVSRTRGRASRVDRLPDGRTALIFRVVEQGRRADITVVGPRTRALLKDATHFSHAVEIELAPGWSGPVLGVPASALTNTFVDLESLWGPEGEDLVGDVLHAEDAAEVLERFDKAVRRRGVTLNEPASARLARRALTSIRTDGARVQHVADRLGVSTRHLRRVFAEHVGVSPKSFARAMRLQRAVRIAETCADWARVAVEAGYYDQAHLIADFRDLVGLTPTAFVKRARERDPRARRVA